MRMFRMNDDLPYHVEYARSGRSKCQICRDSIDKDSLRIATVLQNPYHDSKMREWYHPVCFFQENRITSIGDISDFDNIRWEDQEYIKNNIGKITPGVVTAASSSSSSENGSRKRNKGFSASPSYKVEYTKLDHVNCFDCEEKIVKGEICLSKNDCENEGAHDFSDSDRWYHVGCFAKMRSTLQFFDEGANISGASSLSKEDQDMLNKALPKIKEEDMPPEAKKIKPELDDSQEEEESLKAQQKKLFSIRDELSLLKKNDWIDMLDANSQDIPVGQNEILNVLADAMMFGALEPCPKCGGQFVFKSGTGYKCKGTVSQWALCDFVTQDPKRKKFDIPEDLKRTNSFLNNFESQVQRRLLKITAPSSPDVIDSSMIKGKPRPLKNYAFVLAGFTKEKSENLRKEIASLGGTVKYKVTEYTAAVITTIAEVEKMGNIIEDAKKMNVHVVSEDFVKEAKEFVGTPLELIEAKGITNWGSEAWMRVVNAVGVNHVQRDISEFIKSSSGKKTLRVKAGNVVDPDSGLEDITHIYRCGNQKYTVKLGKTDIQTKKNSFYKLQILKHDDQEKYWLFRKWGRIGTTIGNQKCDSMPLEECIKQFEDLFWEKTGNGFWDRDFAPKEPGKYYVMPDSDQIDGNTIADLVSTNVESKLEKPIQDLMRLIFDVNSMKKFMLEYDIDEEKMPLGKISQEQIMAAYSVLSELSNLIKNGVQDKTRFTGLSNRFYALIPHNFNVDRPSIIESEAEIQAKSEMLESLSKIEIAYRLVQIENDVNQNPLDAQYEQLKTNIEVLNHESDEFKLIVKYVKNTHAKMHNAYELSVEEVFIINRNGEESRYQPFKKLGNRKLLWHGTRVTNFVSILTQGLKIAPPEAPPNGCMFGRGIYFADLVSKSANYCIKDYRRPTALLLLCDVALGNMYECCKHLYPEYKLSDGYHSTWGRGKVQPDPAKSEKLKTDIEVPCGPIIPAEIKDSEVDHNEFIVYDEAQLKIEYIVQLNFLYKDRFKK